MKKRLVFFMNIALMVLLLCTLTACGGNMGTQITDTWKLVEMTSNGKTVTDESLLSIDAAPKFSCSDGKNFVFSLNGKEHSGILSESGGIYTLSFNDTNKKMEARISGDTLTISIVGQDASFKFKKQ